MPHRRHLLPPALVAVDAVAVALTLLLVGAFAWWPAYVAAVAAVVVAAQTLSLYRARLTVSVLDDMPSLLVAAIAGIGAHHLADITRAITPLSAAVEIAVLMGTLAGLRAGLYAVVREARRRGLFAHRLLVLGTGEVGRKLVRSALDHPEYGLVPVGFVDDEIPSDFRDLDVPHLGGIDDLARLVRREHISEVIIASGVEGESVVDTVRECDRLDTEVFAVPSHYELHHRSRDMDELWGIPLTRFRRGTWRTPSWRLKRAFDVVASGGALLALSPLLLVVALAVRLEMGKGIIFRQVRVGLDGAPFTIYKFRSLRLPADAGAVWSINGDARLGRVGKFIRATSIDELPQLVNVLRGDMSIVGPRPERPVFVDQFSAEVPQYHSRHRTPAGLTGWAQVNGLRGDTSIAERARFDNYYIQNWSLWLDAKIITRTVGTVLLRRGS
ncbi:sugar transferase [Nocardioides sp. C4-1]|uniref:sugar transferase n=1 Tax=Nocardioides sp. C4-1 TaxID=3151851 RepID=UPI003266D1DD